MRLTRVLVSTLICCSCVLVANAGLGAGSPFVAEQVSELPASGASLALNPNAKAPAQFASGPVVAGLTDIAYGEDAIDSIGLSFPVTAPGVVYPTGPTTDPNGFLTAGDFAPDPADPNVTNLYVMSFYGTDLYTMDTATGALTLVGSSLPGTGDQYSGMAYDETTGTMYAATRDDLFTLDLATGAATLVGQMVADPNAALIISIAVDCAGNLYGHDIINDELGSIDKVTGAYTAIGPCGFNANYAQGMEFDTDCSALYMAAYNYDTGAAELRTVDVTTGATTLVGTIDAGELGFVAFGPRPLVSGSCCDDYDGICLDVASPYECPPGLRFTPGVACADLDPSCGIIGACCDASYECLGNMLQSECDALGGRFYAGEDCATFICPEVCDHSIVLYDTYGDGWNGGLVDVIVDGSPALTGLTIASGGGPEAYVFQAATGSVIETVYTAGAYPSENQYEILDVVGDVLCSDGFGGVTPSGVTCTGNCEADTGACCDQYTGICTIVAQFDCPPGSEFTPGLTSCDQLDPPCGILGACCDPNTLTCIGTMYEADCDAQGGRFYPGEDCATFVCPDVCEHTIVLRDTYGDGWNGGLVDVVVDGSPVLTGLTIADGYGPESHTFMASTGSTIETIYTVGSYGSENEYDILDVAGLVLCSDGLGGATPTGVTCTGNCEIVAGACCNEYDGVCEDVGSEAECAYTFYDGVSCLDIDCGIMGACCDPNTLSCVGTMLQSECDALGGKFYAGEDCADFVCPVPCDHTIVLEDSYGDGWNGGSVDVLVAGTPVLTGLTIIDGAGPESHVFQAATGDTITTIYTAGSYASENSYQILDVNGVVLCADGESGAPVGITCTANCLMEGACCYSDGTCAVTAVADCTGLFLGVGTACEPNNPCATGACCYDDGTCADVDEASCTGVFQGYGTQCETTYCPLPGDACGNPLVIGPAEPNMPPIVTTNYTCGRGNNYEDTCLGFYDGGEDIIYELVVAQDTYLSLTLDPNGLTYSGIAVHDACPLDPNECIGVSTSGFSSDPHGIECEFFAAGSYYIMIDTWPSPDCLPYFTLTIAECVPCRVECPPDAIDEAEICGEDTNGGCNGDPNDPNFPMFDRITCGDTVCGTSWFDGSLRDTDWYEVVVSEPTVLTLTAEAEFDMLVGFLEQTYCGVTGCDNFTGSVSPNAIVDKCVEGVVTTECLWPGTYYVFVAPQFNDDVDCPAIYTLSLDCTSCTIDPNDLGACCLPEGGCELMPECACTGVFKGVGSTCEPNDPCLTGACCFADATCEDYDETTCVNAGGTFFGWGTECVTTICPTPGDSCDNALVIGPIGLADLPVVDVNLTCGRGNNYSDTCMGSYDGGEDMIYQLEVYEDMTVDITLDPGPTTWTGVAIHDSCPLDPTSCMGTSTSSSAAPHKIEGMTLTAGTTYYIMVDTYPSPDCIPSFTLTIGQACAESFECPPGATPEGEADCGEFGDINNGCNVDDPNFPLFMSIGCNEVICGTLGTYTGLDPNGNPTNFRDTDWYEVTIEPNSPFEITAQSSGEFVYGLIGQTALGVPGCANLTGSLSDYHVAPGCEEPPTTVTVANLPAGTYYLFVSLTVFDGVPCGQEYWLTVNCSDTQPLCQGDSNCDGIIDWQDIDFFVAAQNDDVASWEAMFLPDSPDCPFENNDVNGDMYVDWMDIDPFVGLMGTTCSPDTK